MMTGAQSAVVHFVSELILTMAIRIQASYDSSVSTIAVHLKKRQLLQA
jgi:hypothetical protein